ncbi:MAG: hypothetical protein ABEJ99_01420 [Candidatus Nanohaloarchaea archaeon]
MSLTKGQAFMPDFLGSMIVFSVIITLFLYSWNSVSANQQGFDPQDQLRQSAYYTATFLVSTPGYPGDWNNTTVEIPGFADPDNVLQPGKLRSFRSLNYSRQRLLLEAPNFDLNFTKDNKTVMLDGKPLQFGKAPSNPDTVAVIRRNVLINKTGSLQDAEMVYLVWQ